MRSTRASTTLVAVLALVGLLAGAQPATAAEERYPVPASGSWQVDGRGWGHGIGMSQWGAQGAAEQGRDYRHILDFYYPGTTMHTVSNSVIRVALTALTPTDTVTVQSPPGNTFAIGAPGDQQVHGEGRYTLTRQSGGYTVERRGRINGEVLARFRVDAPTIELSTGDGVMVFPEQDETDGTWYRGTVQLVGSSGAPEAFDVVNHVRLEDYLRGVVPRESPSGWHLEALKSQAVAARSYALTEHKARHFDTCDTTQCQVYGGRAAVVSDGVTAGTDRHIASKEAASTDRAIRETAGQVRWFDGAVAFTQFHSTNGGHSRAGSRPYLVARPDPYTGTASADSRTTWTATLRASTVGQHCPANGRLETMVVTGRDGNGPMGGRITSMRLECTTGSVNLTGDLRLRFGMYSPWWKPTAAPTPEQGFFLNDAWTTEANHVFRYGQAGDVALSGDWDGDGVDTIALRRGNQYFFSDSHGGGTARTAVYGRPDDVVLVGDWDGDGVDTLAVRRGAAYHIKNSISSGPGDRTIAYGRAGDSVVVGDWDGDGTDTLAVRRGPTYLLKNSMTSGPADSSVVYGRASDVVLIGDWDGNGTDTLAVRRGRAYFVKNSITPGPADIELAYGRPTDAILVGDWDGNGTDTLGVRR